jgi:ribosomal protein L7Ae-like RNA K-turn-binding protein
LLPDLYGKLPGRGIHLCPDIACFDSAAQQSLSRAFRAPTILGDPQTLAESFLQAAGERIKTLLGTCVRSGWLYAGRSSVEEALQSNRVALLLLAGDCSPHLQREMLERAATCKVPCHSLFSVEELSAFHRGKPLAVLGVRHRGIARRITEEILKASSLAESMVKHAKESRSKLTVKPDHGKMPKQRAARAGSLPDRS